MHSHSFEDTELKLHMYVNYYLGQVVDGLRIILYPRGLENKGLITQKMLFRLVFAQFSRYRAENLQVSQRFLGLVRGGVNNSTRRQGA